MLMYTVMLIQITMKIIKTTCSLPAPCWWFVVWFCIELFRELEEDDLVSALTTMVGKKGLYTVLGADQIVQLQYCTKDCQCNPRDLFLFWFRVPLLFVSQKWIDDLFFFFCLVVQKRSLQSTSHTRTTTSWLRTHSVEYEWVLEVASYCSSSSTRVLVASSLLLE